MSKRTIGIVLLAVVCELLGVATAQVFFSLFKSTVPPMALGAFQSGAAHVAFLFYGAALGAVIFGVAIVSCLCAPLFRASKPERDSAAKTDPSRG